MSETPVAIDFPGYFFEGITLEILLRVALAAGAGTLLGIEREKHGRAAGLRTTLMVTLASCVAMILSDAFYEESFAKQPNMGSWHPDPARLAAGVLAGMGFLGAGVIIRQSNHMVRGVTTAATIWFVTIIGIAFGAGAIGIGLLATVSSLMILSAIPYVESKIPIDWYSDLTVTYTSSVCSLDRLVDSLAPLSVQVKGTDLEQDLENDRSEVVVHLRYKRAAAVDFTRTIIGLVSEVPGVLKVSIKS
ncbi:MgtC/SapB family protein [Luteolibacter yonseiensis]|uniref:MgtC/SapB family protein n=1 Tax=Luteolibacter yonseiensis TaxID=1144680 RepID=A0A934VC95_9BACT|nr:MgtC/SapB family protein [Luteolibacter yonseiensis]MBK1816741.1 MgtC/SapB family protein [Luteolibacter yonseiensis]